MRFWRCEPFRSAIIQYIVIEVPRSHRFVEALDGTLNLVRGQAQLDGKFADGIRPNGGKDGWNESTGDLRIDDRPCDLPRLLGDQTSPNGVAFRPQVFPFIVEADALA